MPKNQQQSFGLQLPNQLELLQLYYS
jgi:hypothetical protein